MSRGPRALAVLLAAAVTAACAGEGPPAEDDGVRLVEGSRSTPAFAEADLSFEAPERGATAGDSLAARLSLEGFALAEPTPGAETRGLAMSDRGQHVHFIVDDRPYRALYDLGAPVTVDLSGLEPGVHLLRAFASRQWHESVKSDGAFALTWFRVGDTAAAEGAFDPEAPMLTYSRPKGTYAGPAADSVMVDFYVSNAELGSGEGSHRVRLTVDDTLDWELTEWAPHYVLGLDEGSHTFRLELLAPDGTVVSGDHNATERTIEIERPGGGGGS